VEAAAETRHAQLLEDARRHGFVEDEPSPPTPPRYLEVLPAAIPAELQAMPWVLWRAEPRPGDPKPAKVPARISDPDQRASSTDPGTWGSFADAIEAYSALAGLSHPRGPIAGIGVVLTTEAQVVCIDLDQVLDGAALDPRAARIVQRCRSWTEVSPSGRGLHVFLRGRLASPIKSPQIEVYGTARFIAITGHVWPGSPALLRNAQDYLDALTQLNRPAGGGAYTGPTSPPPDDLAGALLAKVQTWRLEVTGSLKAWEDGFLLELRRCPWADVHTTGSGGAWIAIRSSGAFDAGCLHAHCGHRRWRDFRARLASGG
jgi:hypothetical protein